MRCKEAQKAVLEFAASHRGPDLPFISQAPECGDPCPAAMAFDQVRQWEAVSEAEHFSLLDGPFELPREHHCGEVQKRPGWRRDGNLANRRRLIERQLGAMQAQRRPGIRRRGTVTSAMPEYDSRRPQSAAADL